MIEHQSLLLDYCIVHTDEIKRLGLGEAVFVNKQNFQVQRIKLRKSNI